MTPHDSTRCADCGGNGRMHSNTILQCLTCGGSGCTTSEPVGAVDADEGEMLARNALGGVYVGGHLDRLARAYLALREQVATLTAIGQDLARECNDLHGKLARATSAEGSAAEPSFWMVIRDDNEMMATGKTHDEAVREFMQGRGGDYAKAVKEGYRCVAIFTKWPTTPPRSPATVTEAMKARAHVALCEVFAEFDDGSWEPSSVDELLEVVITAALGGRDA